MRILTTNNNNPLTIQSRWYAEIRPTTSWNGIYPEMILGDEEDVVEEKDDDDSPTFVEYVVVKRMNNDDSESEIRWKIPS